MSVIQLRALFFFFKFYGIIHELSLYMRYMKDNTTYYIRYDQGKRSVVMAGTFEYLKRKVFQNILQEAKDRSQKPFFWPRDINSLVKTLNYATNVLGKPMDFYALTTREQADKKHWPIIEPENGD